MNEDDPKLEEEQEVEDDVEVAASAAAAAAENDAPVVEVVHDSTAATAAVLEPPDEDEHPPQPQQHHHHDEDELVAAVEDATASSTVAAAAAAAAQAASEEVKVVEDVTTVPTSVLDPKRRFFPRIKLLLTKDWEYFLQGILHSIESNAAQYAAAASHRPANSWYRTFHSVYGGVAADFSVPTGKNRYHKFKDKIVELWEAMEAEPHHSMHKLAVSQLAAYRNALVEKRKSAKASPAPSAELKTPTPVTTTTVASPLRPAALVAATIPTTTTATVRNTSTPARLRVPAATNGAPPRIAEWNAMLQTFLNKLQDSLQSKDTTNNVPASLQELLYLKEQSVLYGSLEEQNLLQERVSSELNHYLATCLETTNAFSVLQELNQLRRRPTGTITQEEAQRVQETYQTILSQYLEGSNKKQRIV